MKQKIAVIAISLLAVAAIALVLAGSLPTRTAQASKVEGYAQYTWGPYNGIITTQTGTGKVTADYGTLECYMTVDVSDTQTVTLQLEHSPNNVVWADEPVWQFATNVLAVVTDFADVSADETSFAIAVAYGQYTRPVITLGTANPVTVTLRCVLKDRDLSIDDQAGAIESTD